MELKKIKKGCDFMSVNKGKRSGGGRAKFFGFPLSKTGANIIYILGILLLIGTLCSFMWLIYSFVIMGSAYAAWGVIDTLYAGSYMTYMIPWAIMEIVMLALAIYMINCGRKGR